MSVNISYALRERIKGLEMDEKEEMELIKEAQRLVDNMERYLDMKDKEDKDEKEE